jgi:hypothetical protein
MTKREAEFLESMIRDEYQTGPWLDFVRLRRLAMGLLAGLPRCSKSEPKRASGKKFGAQFRQTRPRSDSSTCGLSRKVSTKARG